MSLLCAVDNALQQCEVEEVLSNDNIFICRDLLKHMKIRDACPGGAEKQLNAQVTKDDSQVISPEVTQELEQLEKLLKKAYRVRQTLSTHAASFEGKGRSASLVNSHKNHSQAFNKVSCDKRPTQVSKAPSHISSTQRIPKTQRQTVMGGVKKESGKTEALKSGENPIKSLNSRCTKGSFDNTCSQDTITKSKQKTSSDDLSRTKTLRPPDADVKAIVGEMWIPSPLLQPWSAMRTKQSRLWDKVLTKGTQAVPERIHFTQKLQNTFPARMFSEAPAETSCRVDFLTELGRALRHGHHAELRMSQTSTEGAPKRQHECEAVLGELETMMMSLLGQTEQLIRALEYYELEPGVLCPVRRKSAWGGQRRDPERTCLAPTVCYHSQAELQEVARLRLRVQALEQEMKLQQILEDHLSCSLSSCSPAHLRGQYSLLGEGGLHFPTLVMDTEPD